MREIEKNHENMSLERAHGSTRPGSSRTHNADEVPVRPSRLPGDQETESTDGSRGAGAEEIRLDEGGRDEDSDEDYVPPEMGNSDDDDSTVYISEDSDDDDELEESAVDSDEIGSDGGYESYGLADL